MLDFTSRESIISSSSVFGCHSWLSKESAVCLYTNFFSWKDEADTMIARCLELFQNISPGFPTGHASSATVALRILIVASPQVLFSMVLKSGIVANAY